jgi:hypothetical protein
MKRKQLLLRLESAHALPRTPASGFRWMIRGRTISGELLTMRTATFGRGERRWIPNFLVGSVVRITFHTTQAGNHIADLWRNSGDEGEDLDALFVREQTLHAVALERCELSEVALPAPDRGLDNRVRL